MTQGPHVPMRTRIARTARTLNVGLALHVTSRSLVPALYVSGAAVLLARMTRSGAWILETALTLPLVAAVAFALVRFRHHRFSLADAAAWLDATNRAGGRYLAAGAATWETAARRREGAVADNPESLSSLEPRVVPILSFLPVLRRLFLPLCFLLATFLVPRPPAARTVPESVLQRVGDVRQTLHDAENLGLVDPKTITALRDQLPRVDDPDLAAESAVEAADEVASRLRRAVAEQHEAIDTALAASATLARALEHGGKRGSPSSSAGGYHDAPADSLANALSQSLQSLSTTLDPASRRALDAALAAAGLGDLGSLSAGQMTSAQLEALARSLEAAQRATREQASRALSTPDGRSLSDMLSVPGGNASRFDPKIRQLSLEEALALTGSGNETTAPLPVMLGDEPDSTGDRFRPEPLEPGVGFLPLVPVGQRVGPPRAGAGAGGGEGSETGTVSAPEGSDYVGVPLSPYHRSVTERYFSEEAP